MTTPVSSLGPDIIVPATASIGTARPVSGSVTDEALAPALLHAGRAALQHQAGDERRELRDVGLHAPLDVLAAAFVRREEALGRARWSSGCRRPDRSR